MVDYLVDSYDLIDISQAIQNKSGTPGSLVFPSGFISAINNIPAQGNGINIHIEEETPVVVPETAYRMDSTTTITLSDSGLWPTNGNKYIHLLATNIFQSARAGRIYACETIFEKITQNINRANKLVTIIYFYNSANELTCWLTTENYGVYSEYIEYSSGNGVMIVKATPDGDNVTSVSNTFSLKAYALDY